MRRKALQERAKDFVGLWVFLAKMCWCPKSGGTSLGPQYNGILVLGGAILGVPIW